MKEIKNCQVSRWKKKRATIKFIQDGGDISKVVEASTKLIMGHIKNAAQVAVQLLAQAMPVLGETFAGAVKAALINPLKDTWSATFATIKDTGYIGESVAKLSGDGDKWNDAYSKNLNNVKSERLNQAGLNDSNFLKSDKDNGWGSADIKEGNEFFDKLVASQINSPPPLIKWLRKRNQLLTTMAK